MDKLASKSILRHTALTAAVFIGFNLVKNQLDASYAASNHPVDYATGQTTFSAEAIRGFYAHMQDLGTLDIYVKTQIIDFGFIAMMMLMGFFVGALVSRVGPAEGYGRKIGKLANWQGFRSSAAQSLISSKTYFRSICSQTRRILQTLSRFLTPPRPCPNSR